MSSFSDLSPFAVCLVVAVLLAGAASVEAGEKSAPALDFTLKSLDGKDVDLSAYKGKVVMIVNTASKCGLTPQYEQLQDLHEKYSGAGLGDPGIPM